MSYGVNFDYDLRYNSDPINEPELYPLLLRPMPHNTINSYNYNTFTYRQNKTLNFGLSNDTASQLLFSRDITGYNVYDPFVNTPNLLMSVYIRPKTPNNFRVKPGPSRYRLILGGRIFSDVNKTIFNADLKSSSVASDWINITDYNPQAFTATTDTLYATRSTYVGPPPPRGTPLPQLWIDPNFIVYYFAEIDFKNRTFSIGKQGLNQKITIYNSTSILGDRFGRLLVSLYDKPNASIPQNSSMELAAKFIGAANPSSPKILRTTITCPGANAPLDDLQQYSSNNSAGSFGMYYINSDINISQLSIAQRSSDDEFVACAPALKTFRIDSTFPSSVSSGFINSHISGVINGVNEIYKQFNVQFVMGTNTSSTGLDNINATPWNYVPTQNFHTTFGYSWPKQSNKFCVTCNPNNLNSTDCKTTYAGCGNLNTGNNGWVAIGTVASNTLTLAHELGHNFGATHTGRGLMKPSSSTSSIDTFTYNIIESGIAARSGFVVANAINKYVPQVLNPVGLETVSSLRFNKNLPSVSGGTVAQFSGAIKAAEGELLYLNVDVTPLNPVGNPVNSTTEIHLAKLCNRSLGCYTWQIRPGGVGDWLNILRRPAENQGKQISIPFNLSGSNTFNEYRCIVNISGIQATSNTARVYRKPDSANILVSTGYTTFTYLNNKDVDFRELPIDNQKNITQVEELSNSFPPAYMGKFIRVIQPCGQRFTTPEECSRRYWSPLYSENTPTFQYGKTYRVYSVANSFPYYIRFPYNTPIILPVGSGEEQPSVPAGVTPDASGEPIYNYDSSWSYAVSGQIESFVMDSRMIIPITGITNIEYIQSITQLSDDGETLIWQSGDPLSNLDVLEYNKGYTVTSSEYPYTLSFDIS